MVVPTQNHLYSRILSNDLKNFVVVPQGCDCVSSIRVKRDLKRKGMGERDPERKGSEKENEEENEKENEKRERGNKKEGDEKRGRHSDVRESKL
jgi:hypothetical protein